jgi:peptide chain release factor 2
LKSKVSPWEDLIRRVNDLQLLHEMALQEGDDSQESSISQEIQFVEKEFERLNIIEMLSEPEDAAPAFLSIQAGAGGTEACDWASMLLRMYVRWCERRGFKIETLDLQEAEGGIKNCTLQVTGENAYGLLKNENGVHRLVRISPFDSNARRHTSFAAVTVSPLIDDDINVEINEKDLRIDTYRSSGAGGQHVNKTDSAVRLTHLPTGIVVACQQERSQIKNRELAMKLLRSKLYDHYKQIRDAEREQKAPEKTDNSWGNQIRSYVFQPYCLVKDHRNKHETSNIQAVMDGELDEFIESQLRHQWLEKNLKLT